MVNSSNKIDRRIGYIKDSMRFFGRGIMQEKKIMEKLVDILLQEKLITAEEKNRMVVLIEKGGG